MSGAVTAVAIGATVAGAAAISYSSAKKSQALQKQAIASQEEQANEALAQQQSADAQQLEASQLALAEQRRATDATIAQYREQSALATKQAEENRNRMNAKLPDTAALRAGNRQGANAGIGSTMLTSAKGVDPGSLKLGKNTLLGQ
jgi:uncharacterized protein YlxW (UPF0749 family)